MELIPLVERTKSSADRNTFQTEVARYNTSRCLDCSVFRCFPSHNSHESCQSDTGEGVGGERGGRRLGDVGGVELKFNEKCPLFPSILSKRSQLPQSENTHITRFTAAVSSANNTVNHLNII